MVWAAGWALAVRADDHEEGPLLAAHPAHHPHEKLYICTYTHAFAICEDVGTRGGGQVAVIGRATKVP